MTLAPGHTRNGRLWTCDACEKVSLWTDEHMVYGSLKDEDESKWHKIVVTCSDGCRVFLIGAGKLPAEGLPK